MFTIRFIKHKKQGYATYSVTSYETTHNLDQTDVVMSLADGQDMTESIGPDVLFDCAFVTNTAGRTIDKIVHS